MRTLVQRVGGARPGEPVPLVLSLHAMGGSVEWSLEALAGLRTPALVAAPCGRESGGACDWFNLHDPRGAAAAAERLVRAVEGLRTREAIRGAPVVMGFSQGAMVAYALAERWPGAVGAAFPVGGVLPASDVSVPPQPGPLPPIFAFGGGRDPVFPVERMAASVEALKARGHRAVLRTYPELGHELPDAVAADVRAAIEGFLANGR